MTKSALFTFAHAIAKGKNIAYFGLTANALPLYCAICMLKAIIRAVMDFR